MYQVASEIIEHGCSTRFSSNQPGPAMWLATRQFKYVVNGESFRSISYDVTNGYLILAPYQHSIFIFYHIHA